VHHSGRRPIVWTSTEGPWWAGSERKREWGHWRSGQAPQAFAAWSHCWVSSRTFR
jgi:hypothetical protein